MKNLSVLSVMALTALLFAGCAAWQGAQDAVSSVANTEPIKTIVEVPKNVMQAMTAEKASVPLTPVAGSLRTAQKPLEEPVEAAKSVVEPVKPAVEAEKTAAEPVKPAVEEPKVVVETNKPAAVEETAKTAPPVEVQSSALVIADFDTGEKPGNLGGDFGSWNKDPNDKTQYCNMSFDPKVKWGNAGYSARLDYTVESPNPAYNGFWMKLDDLDASKFKNLVFYVKGDPEKKFTNRFKVELKNRSEVGKYMVNDVAGEWQKITIPLNAFNGLSDISALTEFVIVFDDINATQKSGSINIDDIYFE
jgi:hypothetical protein